MEKVRFALVQLAWPDMRELMMKTYHELVAAAAQDGAQVVGLPELSISPYFPARRDQQGFQWAEPLYGGTSDQFFGELAQQYGVYILGSIFEKAEDGYWDTATIHNPSGALIASTRKVHIPSGEGYHETDFFQSATDYPVHDIGLFRLAVPTCYDQWFPELARIYALNRAECIFYPTAIGSEPTAPDFDSQEAWQTVMRGHAIANGVFIAAANRIGHENDVTFYGSSFICDPTGCILAQAGRDTAEYIIADLEPQTMQRYRNLFPLLHQRKPHTYGRLTEAVNTPLPERWDGEL